MRILLLFITAMFAQLTFAAPKPPAAPDGFRVTGATSTSVGLTWYDSKGGRGAITYYVFRGALGLPVTSLFNVGSTTLTSYTDTGLTPGTNYQYVLQARDSTGESSAYTTPVVATTACAPPTGLLVTSLYYNSVALAWTPPSGCAVSSYDVLRNGTPI